MDRSILFPIKEEKKFPFSLMLSLMLNTKFILQFQLRCDVTRFLLKRKTLAVALINYFNDIANSGGYMNEKTNKSQKLRI